MGISGLLDESLIFIDVSFENKSDLLDYMSSQLYAKHYVKEEYIQGVKDREKQYPTGLELQGTNCAIPHSEMEYVNKPCVSIARLESPVVFQSMENPAEEIEVFLVFMLAIDDGHKQVSVLQELADLLQSTETVNGLVQSDDISSMVEIIKDFEQSGKEKKR